MLLSATRRVTEDVLEAHSQTEQKTHEVPGTEPRIFNPLTAGVTDRQTDRHDEGVPGPLVFKN